jgi:two-component system, OmpR family, KDP operon response regulator KdpE
MTESQQPTILVIEDEEPIRKFLRVSLGAQGYRLVESANGKDGLLQAATAQPDLIILDLGLPDMDGVDLTRQIREWSQVPIIIVSARGKEQDKVVALDAGADDYLTKPFSVSELLARLRVALRHRVATHADAAPLFENGHLKVDLVRREVTLAGNPIHLTPNEYRLLALLVKYAGRVLTHRQLLKEIWGPGSSQETHYLRVYMNQLRQKLEPDPAQPKYLITEPGIGYRLTEAETNA